MGESHENLLKAVRHYQESLDKYTENRNDGKLLHYLEKLYRLPIKVIHLEQTGVGRTVNGLRKLGGEVGDSAKSLVAKWKEMVVGEQEQEEEDEEEDDEEDDEEDGYQTGEEQSNDSDDKDERDGKRKRDTSSSHRKSDSHRTDDRDKTKKSKHSSTKSDHEEESKSRRDKKHHKHNGHISSSSKHKSHKRKIEDSSSSDDDSAGKRQKRDISPEEEDRYKHKKKNESDSEVDNRSREKKHRSDEEKKRHKSKKSRDSSSDVEYSHRTNKIKEKHRDSSSSKDKQKSSKKDGERKHEHSKKTKEKDKKSESSKSKEVQREVKNKEKNEDKKPKSSKSKSTALSHTGIDSGSGASFAEALGMCEPSSSKNSVKKKSSGSNSSTSSSSSSNNNNNNNTSSEKKEKCEKKTEESIPKLLKEPVIEPIDINISSLLPPITPNYRPLGNLINTESQPKKFMTDYEALSSIITSKNQRTKVYSGNKIGGGKVPSLFELCIRVLQDNIDALEYTGGVPYNVLKPILEKSNPNQLYVLEHHNPYLIEDTDELWQLHCQKEFRNKKREEFETWREMYLRCLDERDAKLKALTANIKQAQDKSLPVRTTKLAYVDAVAKPPRNIARKQAKNGTAVPERKPTAMKLSALATAGEAGKVAVPNPGSRAVERSGGSHAVKPKKAPLMLKSISSFKNRFKR